METTTAENQMVKEMEQEMQEMETGLLRAF